MVILPSGYVKIAMENGPVEVVSFPIKMVIFHSFLYVYQRLPDAIGTLEISSCVASKVADCSSSRQKMRQPKTFRATSLSYASMLFGPFELAMTRKWLWLPWLF